MSTEEWLENDPEKLKALRRQAKARRQAQQRPPAPAKASYQAGDYDPWQEQDMQKVKSLCQEAKKRNPRGGLVRSLLSGVLHGAVFALKHSSNNNSNGTYTVKGPYGLIKEYDKKTGKLLRAYQGYF